MRLLTAFLLSTILTGGAHAAMQHPVETKYFVSGPGGTYGFYQMDNEWSEKLGFRSTIIFAGRGYRVPFRVTSAFDPTGFYVSCSRWRISLVSSAPSFTS
jgi:hypothetical protein